MRALILLVIVAFAGAFDDQVDAKNRVACLQAKGTSCALRSTDRAIGKQNIRYYAGVGYVGNITIGTPSTQSFTVLLSTSSSDFWIPDSSCTSDLCNSKNRYDSSKSSSYQKDGRSWSNKNALGFLGKDSMAFGGPEEEQFAVANQIFGQATTSSAFNNYKVDGILGLSFTVPSDEERMPPVFNAIKQGLLAQPLFSIWMPHKNAENVNSGQITYGGLDTEHCGDVIDYEPLTSSNYWQFRVKSVTAGNYTSKKGWYMISDTSSATIRGPPSMLERLVAGLGGKYSSGYKKFTVRCKQTSFPTITLEIGSNKYTIESANYLSKISTFDCEILVEPYDYGGFGPAWVLGDPFIRSYCQIYDIAQQRIGFAPSTPKE